jgi:hypothetical protein
MSARSETFVTQWPGVLLEMKDYLDLTFLASGQSRGGATVRIFISRALVPQARLQPHMREFRASLARIPQCRVEIKATADAAHRIEIEYPR